MRMYASVGKLILKRALGLQRNYKQIEYKTVSKLDERSSGCFGCSNHSSKQVYANQPESDAYRSACALCEQCAQRVFVEEQEEIIKYVNENNRYGRKQGYVSTLKTNGIKLLLVLHMMNPNSYGHIFELPVSKLKLVMKCDRKTVKANLDRLKQYGYIDFVEASKRGLINVVLKGYEDYFKPAKEGGRGFLTISKELVEALLTIEDLTTLRLFLHQLVDADNHSHTVKKVFEKTYPELLRALPEYYKPNHVKKGLRQNLNNPIFQLRVEDKVVFILNQKYDARTVKAEAIKNSKECLTKYFEELNDNFVKVNEGELCPEECLQEAFCKASVKEYEPFVVGHGVIEDLAKMSLQVSLEDIKSALDFVYMTYVLNHRIIENMAGLVYSLIPDVRQINKQNALAA